ncbi:MAG: TetM/TetW/TetO/TetS family tetracycline resistance ribosomal protection protein [Oscillospiraceae bacterium]|nr:TetM/TetW/TetO/TetS family tetracycline resistance ribosomal protection protein [Oscillospiraceae bacterium]
MQLNTNNQNASSRAAIGILAHVDAGKTTLAEALLYSAGKLRTMGRVDHGNTVMDTHTLEKERGITIFASEATFSAGNTTFTLLDTPGHVDFSAETERVLQVLDCAVLVISGIDGVQSHTRTLWKLLSLYRIPTLIFVTKMDFARHSKEEIIENLHQELSTSCIDFSSTDRDEAFAVCREDLLDKYLENGELDISDISELVKSRLAFPCFFGSGLKLTGIEEFLQALPQLITPAEYPETFGARVFKISRDARGDRLTHLKVTGGVLRVKDIIGEQKINQIRIYSGGKYETVDEIAAGGVCAITGLSTTYGGEGLGYEQAANEPYLEPVMSYKLFLPDDVDPQTMLPKLKLLQEEDPQLKFTWNAYLQEIHVSLMGEVQTEILKSIILERFGIETEVGIGRVMYKETIKNKVEGIGHYEPLRHYAEVHLILEPLPRGSGLVFETSVSEDILDRNWQRLILMHLGEKQHFGVLTGAPITDMKITLAAGRAHIKHTEGGDFRQATYRAVRHGLMYAESVLLEPYYDFRLEVPHDQIGRAINDIRAKNGSFESPEESGGMYLLSGRAPVITLDGYAAELAAYTGGRGRLSLEVSGYDVCHNADAVISELEYSPESDLENTPDSVFCAHGGGFNVKWDQVHNYMHLESCLRNNTVNTSPAVNQRNFHISDKELEEIMLREFGPIRRKEYGIPAAVSSEHAAKNTKPAVPRKNVLIVDGYNVIFAWDDLKTIAQSDLDLARSRLMDLLNNYSIFTRCETVLVFDAYLVPSGTGKKFDYNNIHVVFTKENETGDNYIEKLITTIGKNERVRVVTSDGLIQLSAVRAGVMRMSASEFEVEMNRVTEEIHDILSSLKIKSNETIGDRLKKLLDDGEI